MATNGQEMRDTILFSGNVYYQIDDRTGKVVSSSTASFDNLLCLAFGIGF